MVDDFVTYFQYQQHNNINELFGSHHNTQDISEAMREIEKSDKKVEQRLG